MIKVGILREIVAMAWDSIRTHKLRSFLTLLGILIGVMTVIGMVSVIQGLNKSFMADLSSLGTDMILVNKFPPGAMMGRPSEELRQRKNLTYDDVTAIERDCPLVKAVGARYMVSVFETVPIKYRDVTTQDAFLFGMNDRFPQVLSVYLPTSGRFISASDILHNTRVCVLGSELADTLFPHTDPLEKEIRIGAEKFLVVGVLQKRGQMFGQSQDNFAGIPITTLTKYYPYEKDSLSIMAVPQRHEDLSEAMEQITNLLRLRRKVPNGKPNDFAVFTQDAFLQIYNQITGAAYLVMIVISSIGLLVGGIGVMNIMLVAAKERTREIGIRKALGARSSDILRQFLIEAVFLTGLGGVLGIIMGFGIAILVRAATPLPASVTFWSVLLGLSVSIGVGLFFGIFPARKASRVDPIISLRYE